MSNILVTGAAGFIGFHLSKSLISCGHRVTGIDSMNSYYDPKLKADRVRQLGVNPEDGEDKGTLEFRFRKLDICEKDEIFALFENERFDYVIHLAAQAGVRYSIENPGEYISSNLIGFFNILEACRRYHPLHLIFASSSSVYGLNVKMPFSVKHHTDHPASLYAATKKSNEMMAHSYAHLFNFPVTGLRFFTVYGPWGRPDMAYFSFTRKILEGKPIEVFNNGDLMRDFTYIDDIISGIKGLLNKAPGRTENFNNTYPDPSVSSAPYKLYNIGNNSPVRLIDFINLLEEIIGKKAVKIYKPMQAGDVYATYADIDDLTEVTGFRPATNLSAGLKSFVDWYRYYYS